VPVPRNCRREQWQREEITLNAEKILPPNHETAAHRVKFFRLPPPVKRDPFSGLSRGWYYKAEAAGEIRMVAIRNRGAVRGVRMAAYDSVMDYIRRAMGEGASRKPVNSAPAPTITGELPLSSAAPDACA
jgi:hypothetical protein